MAVSFTGSQWSGDSRKSAEQKGNNCWERHSSSWEVWDDARQGTSIVQCWPQDYHGTSKNKMFSKWHKKKSMKGVWKQWTCGNCELAGLRFAFAADLRAWTLSFVKEICIAAPCLNWSHNKVISRDVWSHATMTTVCESINRCMTSLLDWAKDQQIFIQHWVLLSSKK